MAIHETADFRVPFRLQQDYRRRVEEAGTSHLLVQRAVRQPGQNEALRARGASLSSLLASGPPRQKPKSGP
jgi:hypothetical protein